MDKIRSLTGMPDLYDDGDMNNMPSKLFEIERRIKNITKKNSNKKNRHGYYIEYQVSWNGKEKLCSTG